MGDGVRCDQINANQWRRTSKHTQKQMSIEVEEQIHGGITDGRIIQMDGEEDCERGVPERRDGRIEGGHECCWRVWWWWWW